MSFSDTQVRRLRAKLNPRHIRNREAEGQTLSYLEGWHVVAEANRIFGFDAWDRETSASDCVWTKQINGRYCAAYVARVRITVRTDGGRVIREGCGVGDSNAATPGQAHDFAAKAAETDATKRALSTFGNAFGLSLYGSASVTMDTKAKEEGFTAPNSGVRTDVMVKPQPAQGSTIKSEAVWTVKAPSSAAVAAHVPISEIFPPDRTQEPERERIDKSVLAISEPRRVRDVGHRQFVAGHPCVVCGRTPAEAHHVRFAQPRAMGRKVSDQFTVPLCALHHRDLHAYGNELSWWSEKKINPIDIAIDLWTRSRSQYWNQTSIHKEVSSSGAAALNSNSHQLNGVTTVHLEGADDVR